MAFRWRHGRKYARLSAEALAWELAMLRAMGLEDVPWDPEVGCPWCREEEPALRGTGPRAVKH